MSELTLTKTQLKKIQKAVQALNDVRQELQDENPDFDINWYLEDCGNLNLMECETHDDDGSPQHDGVIETFNLNNSSGGGW